jgi:cytochrome P450
MSGLSDPSVQDDPFEYYASRLATCPVWHEDDIDLWVIGGLAEAREALQDLSTFSSVPSKSRRASDAQIEYHRMLSTHGWARQATLQRTDPPVHTRYRKLLNRVFTPAAVRGFTSHIDEIARSLADDIAARGECEFVADFALPLPGIFIAEQLGLDRTQYRTFRRWADAMLALANRPQMSVEEARHEAEVELEAQHFLAAEFERRRAEPGDDLISMLVHAHGEDEEPFTMGELQDLMHQLVTGGFETTTAAISKGLLLLLQHPDQLALLRERRDLLGNFVEEVLRHDPPVQGLWRQAICPAHTPAGEIPVGASVMMRFGAANRDPRVFDDPDRFDITRHNARNHAAFGFGVHFCVGASLARQEMTSAFEAILDRFATIELAGELERPLHDPSIFLRPMRRLPLRVTPA